AGGRVGHHRARRCPHARAARRPARLRRSLHPAPLRADAARPPVPPGRARRRRGGAGGVPPAVPGPARARDGAAGAGLLPSHDHQPLHRPLPGPGPAAAPGGHRHRAARGARRRRAPRSGGPRRGRRRRPHRSVHAVAAAPRGSRQAGDRGEVPPGHRRGAGGPRGQRQAPAVPGPPGPAAAAGRHLPRPGHRRRGCSRTGGDRAGRFRGAGRVRAAARPRPGQRPGPRGDPRRGGGPARHHRRHAARPQRRLSCHRRGGGGLVERGPRAHVGGRAGRRRRPRSAVHRHRHRHRGSGPCGRPDGPPGAAPYGRPGADRHDRRPAAPRACPRRSGAGRLDHHAVAVRVGTGVHCAAAGVAERVARARSHARPGAGGDGVAQCAGVREPGSDGLCVVDPDVRVVRVGDPGAGDRPPRREPPCERPGGGHARGHADDDARWPL
ncbi:MAG: hypothetical protein AVDCRST_MAG16-547, partial [uncultured Frankineae bacterium]